MKTNLSWDEYFMLQAMIAAFKSKDPTTKVGSVFVDDQNHQITMGYNGMVAGIDETQISWEKDPTKPLAEQKYAYVVHAETNAILHSPRSLAGSRLYVTLFPCHECAKLIASVRCKEVIYLSNKDREKESALISKRILDLSGIAYRQLLPSEELLKKLQDHLTSMLDSNA